MKIFSYCLLGGVKSLCLILYRYKKDVKKTSATYNDMWKDLKIFVFLNHTSLYDALFLGIVPNSILFRIPQKLVAPAADITIDRPIVGKFWKILMPGLVSITRRRDSSWRSFLSQIQDDSIIAIAPEGRMMRKDGLDKYGNHMSVRGGITEILMGLKRGKMIICTSGGMHHIQAPGEKWPKFFKKIEASVEEWEISDFIEKCEAREGTELKNKIRDELNSRLVI